MNKNYFFISFILFSVIIFSFIFLNKDNSKAINNESSIHLSSLFVKTNSELKTGHKIQVQIQNGCGFSGIAKVYTNFLRSHGYDVLEYKNAPHFNFDKTQLIVHKKDTSNFVDEMIKILQIKPDLIKYKYDTNFIYEMTLVIGHDYNSLNSYNEVTMHYEPF